MGVYVNPDNYEFGLDVNDYIYIDKTGLIAHINNRLGRASRYLCVSRPRRFGKTMAANMLAAYYSKGCDSRELFAAGRIAEDPSFTAHLNQHNVIRIDVQSFLPDESRPDTFIRDFQRAVARDLIKEFPECSDINPDERLQWTLNEVFSQTGERFIFIIDEWDCIFRAKESGARLQKRYLDFLRGLFKGTVYTELVYMTGILPIKKYGEHSALNMFEEYSVIEPDELSNFYGFTEEEVREKCLEYCIDFEEMKRWYDGYLLDGEHIYNPQAVAYALRKREFRSYWTGTETYDALKVYIEQNYDGLREAVVEMLGGGRHPVDTTSFQNDMTTFRSKDDVLTLLVHLGYLTYDKSNRAVYIPDLEVRNEFERAIKNGSGWGLLMQSLKRSMQLLKDTWNMDAESVAGKIGEIHSETVSWLKFNDENSLACVIYIAYYSAAAYYLKPVQELPTGDGRADIVFLPRKNSDCPALLIELKWDKSAESAIQQIKDKNYPVWIRSYTGNVLLVGINYDKKTKKHSCIIEKYITVNRD